MSKKTFKGDCDENRKDEYMMQLVLEDLLGKGWTFEQVGTNKKYFHKGDIIATNPLGKVSMFEVKNDSRWCGSKATNRIFAEYRVDFKNPNGLKTTDGYMTYDYETVLVNNRECSRVLVVDFARWKECFRNCKYGFHAIISHPEYEVPSISFGHLNDIDALKKDGVLIGEIGYSYTGKYESPDSVWVEYFNKFPEYKEKKRYWEKRIAESKRDAA